MRPITMSNPPQVPTARTGEDEKIESLPPEGAIGSAELRELVAQLRKELLPGNLISRSTFLNLLSDTPLDAREEQHVDLKTMVGLIIAQAALEKSMPIRSMNHKSSAADDYYTAREQSPIRGAPRLSPLPRPESEVLPPNAGESLAGDTNPDPRV